MSSSHGASLTGSSTKVDSPLHNKKRNEKKIHAQLKIARFFSPASLVVEHNRIAKLSEQLHWQEVVVGKRRTSMTYNYGGFLGNFGVVIDPRHHGESVDDKSASLAREVRGVTDEIVQCDVGMRMRTGIRLRFRHYFPCS